MFGNFIFGAGYFARVMRAIQTVTTTTGPSAVGPPPRRPLVKIGGAVVRVDILAVGGGATMRQPAIAWGMVRVTARSGGRRVLPIEPEPLVSRRSIRRSRRR